MGCHALSSSSNRAEYVSPSLPPSHPPFIHRFEHPSRGILSFSTLPSQPLLPPSLPPCLARCLPIIIFPIASATSLLSFPAIDLGTNSVEAVGLIGGIAMVCVPVSVPRGGWEGGREGGREGEGLATRDLRTFVPKFGLAGFSDAVIYVHYTWAMATQPLVRRPELAWKAGESWAWFVGRQDAAKQRVGGVWCRGPVCVLGVAFPPFITSLPSWPTHPFAFHAAEGATNVRAPAVLLG